MKKLSCWGTIDVMRIFILNWCERDAALSIPNSIFKSVEAVTRIFDVSHLLRWKSKWEHVKWIQKEVIHQNVGLIVRWTTDIKERFGWMTVMLGEANALIIQCCCERSRAESCKLSLWWWNSGGSWLCRTEQRFKDLYWFVYSFDWHVIIMEIKHRLFDQTQRETRAIVGNWLLNTTDKQKKERERERSRKSHLDNVLLSFSYTSSILVRHIGCYQSNEKSRLLQGYVRNRCYQLFIVISIKVNIKAPNNLLLYIFIGILYMRPWFVVSQPITSKSSQFTPFQLLSICCCCVAWGFRI